MNGLALSLDVSAVPDRPAGAGRYTLELAQALATRDDIALHLVTRRHDGQRFEQLRDARIHPVVPDARVLRLGYERALLGRTVDRLGVTVHHGPHYTMPTTRWTPVVVTIHDLTFFDRPEVHQAAKVRFFTAAIERAAREAACLVCVSERTKTDLLAHVDVRAPVVVATHGIDQDRFIADEPGDGVDAAELVSLGLDPTRRRVLALGTLEPRKGVVSLIEAVAPLLAAGDIDELVLAGQRGWDVDQVDRAIAASGVAGSIRQLGYVDDDAVPALLRTAAVVSYASLDEGFGLPALEALGCGSRLVTSSGSVMAEICGAAPWYVDPTEVSSIRAGILDALAATHEDVERRRAVGRALAAAATWDRAAALHVDAYRLAASSTGAAGRSH